MSDDHIPPPPTPPENRVECSSCGFIAPKSEFDRVHGEFCRSGAMTVVLVGACFIFGFALLIFSKFA